MLENKHKFTIHDFIVVKQGLVTLLELPSCIALGLVETACTLSNKNVSLYTDVFEGLGRLTSKHALRLKEGQKPVIPSARRVPFRLRDKLKCALDSMESAGTINRIQHPTDWVHPIGSVLKPDGSLRICLYPTELNKAIKREHYALPTATKIFAKLTHSGVLRL